jgi:hypothetical protein
MELNNLKEAWTALDNRLKRTEKLKESIILEMMRSKAGKLVTVQHGNPLKYSKDRIWAISALEPKPMLLYSALTKATLDLPTL